MDFSKGGSSVWKPKGSKPGFCEHYCTLSFYNQIDIYMASFLIDKIGIINHMLSSSQDFKKKIVTDDFSHIHNCQQMCWWIVLMANVFCWVVKSLDAPGLHLNRNQWGFSVGPTWEKSSKTPLLLFYPMTKFTLMRVRLTLTLSTYLC